MQEGAPEDAEIALRERLLLATHSLGGQQLAEAVAENGTLLSRREEYGKQVRARVTRSRGASRYDVAASATCLCQVPAAELLRPAVGQAKDEVREGVLWDSRRATNSE